MNDSKQTPGWAKVALLLILVLDVWWRCHTIGPTIQAACGFAPYPVVVGEAEPLDCDEAAYAYIGRGLAHGAVMYRDLSENKPPLGYWLYALTVAIGGANELTVRLMPIPFVLATISLVAWLGWRLKGPVVGCVAALVYVLLSTDPYLYGNGANMEHFINLFAVGSLAAMVRWFESQGSAGELVPTAPRGNAVLDAPRRLRSRPLSTAEDAGASQTALTQRNDGRRWLVVAGACVALATLVKQVAALHGLIYVLAVVLAPRNASNARERLVSILKDGLALAFGFLIPVLLAVFVLVLQGAGADAYEDIIGYGSALASIKVAEPFAPAKWVRWFTGNADPMGKLPPPFGLTRYLVWWGGGSWPIWLASVPALAWLLIKKGSGWSTRLVVAWTLGCWVQVALPGLFWAHYYLLPTPGLALVVAVALGDAVSLIRCKKAGPLMVGMVAFSIMMAAVGWTVRLQVRDYLFVAPEQLTARFKGGQQWIALRNLGREIGRRSREWPRPTLYVWGWQSPLFIYSGLDGPTRHFFADPLLEDYSRGHHRDHPRVQPRVDRIMRDLEARPPSVALIAYPPFPPLRRYLEDRYVRSTLTGMNTNSPDDLGLWIERDHYREFEAATGAPRSATAR